MNEKEPQDPQLRRRAERLLTEQPERIAVNPPQDIQELLYELQVYQAELEVQNEELRQAQTALIEANDRYRFLYDFAPVGYITLNGNRKIVRANLLASEMLGVDRSRLIGLLLIPFLEHAEYDKVDNLLRKVTQEGPPQRCEAALRRNDSRRFVHIEARSTGGGEGGEAGIVLSLTDITDLKRSERNLQTLNQDLERRVAERTAEERRRADQLRQLALRLSRVEQQERRRLAQELHDYLAQLLVVASMRIDVCRRSGPQLPELGEFLREMSEVISEAQQYTRTLMVELSPAVLYDVGLEAAIHQLADRMSRRGLYVQVETQGQDTGLPTDDAALAYQCVRELLMNTLKHAGVIDAKVSLTFASSELQVEVSDNGRGFYPQAPPERQADGDRFGLLSVEERVKALGGSFTLRSAPDQGTHVSFVLPLREPASALPQTERRAPTDEAPPEILPASDGRKVRILIADDHAMIREGLRTLIEGQDGLVVTGEASTGREAVHLAHELHPDVVLMDINMPEMNGIEATRRIKSEIPEITVIGISVQEEESAGREMRKAGASAYLSKAAASHLLIDAIRQTQEA